MLKLTYTENKLSLDYSKQSLEDWVNTRVLISVRSATTIYIESSTASLLVPADSSFTAELEKLNSQNIIEFCRCDADAVEVVLKGFWLASEVESETGVFVTEADKYTESVLHKMFDCELFCHA
ncbi:MAG: alr0857 family protein [Cyanobacteria bacterium P01_D01_bin.50]